MEIEVVLDYDAVSASRGRQLLLMARIKAPPVAQTRRAPLNLSVVLDRSGSMAGQKLEYVKRAARLIPQYLSNRDRFSLVTYHETVDVLLQPQAAEQKDLLNSAIDSIQTGWGTNLSGGWLMGCQLVAQGIREGPIHPQGAPAVSADEKALALAQINRVFLLTDGLANQGITDRGQLTALARHKREENIVTSTIGVGMDFNEDLLVDMASEGGGEFYFIDSPDQAPQIFTRLLGHLAGIAAQNLSITLTTLCGSAVQQQFSDYPGGRTSSQVSYRLGDLSADERKTLLVGVSIPPLAPGSVEIARVRFDYDELGDENAVHQTQEFALVLQVVPEHETPDQEANLQVLKAFLLLDAARARREAITAADRRDFSRARSALSDAADAIEGSGMDDEDLRSEHDMLRQEAIDMEFGDQRYDAYARKFGVTASLGLDEPQHAGYTRALHERVKGKREAIERNGPTPTSIKWAHGALELDMDLLRIGRNAENDICVPEEEASRYHCQIVREGDNLYLYDLNSTNGTFANGGRITGRFRLSAGDGVTVGTWLFRFEANPQPAGPPGRGLFGSRWFRQ